MQALIPVRTRSTLNVREHWGSRASRAKHERKTTYIILRAEELKLPKSLDRGVARTVTMTRMGPSRGLDSDNLAASLKGVRDGVADFLGVDDRDPSITWVCAQEKAKAWAVRIEIA